MRAALLMTVLAAGLLAACSPLRLVDAVTPAGGYDRTEAIAYGEDPRQRLDVYVPAGAATDGTLRPVVVFFYGGTWNTGRREQYRFVGQALAARGIVVVIPDYRLYPQVRYPEFLVDSASAVAWALREARRFGGDPARVHVAGHSAGAYNAAMVALDERWLRSQQTSPAALAGWVGLEGPYDFLPIVNPDAKPVFFHPDYPPNTQPIEHAGPQAPRTFLATAREDEIVNPQRNTIQLAQRLRDAGVPVELKIYGRVDHSTMIGAFAWPLRWLAPVLDDVVDFVCSPDLSPRASTPAARTCSSDSR